MKIYFAGSIRGGRDDQPLYFQIIELLTKYGVVLTEHLGHQNLSASGEASPEELIYKRDMTWLHEADVVVAEVSTPSLGVGYELSKVEDMHKPLLCLFRSDSERMLSAMIAGNKEIKVAHYTNIQDVSNSIQNFFQSLN